MRRAGRGTWPTWNCTVSCMAPRCTGMWGALETSPPSGPKRAQEKSRRSLMLVEMAVRCRMRPICSGGTSDGAAGPTSPTAPPPVGAAGPTSLSQAQRRQRPTWTPGLALPHRGLEPQQEHGVPHQSLPCQVPQEPGAPGLALVRSVHCQSLLPAHNQRSAGAGRRCHPRARATLLGRSQPRSCFCPFPGNTFCTACAWLADPPPDPTGRRAGRTVARHTHPRCS